MSKKIKLLWDFRGADANATAKHHAIHLEQYAKTESLDDGSTGCQKLSDFHSTAYIVVTEAEMLKVRDALLPHRGELHMENSTS